jgi:hypothetical protein
MDPVTLQARPDFSAIGFEKVNHGAVLDFPADLARLERDHKSGKGLPGVLGRDQGLGLGHPILQLISRDGVTVSLQPVQDLIRRQLLNCLDLEGVLQPTLGSVSQPMNFAKLV